jgi:hypothetical protein
LQVKHIFLAGVSSTPRKSDSEPNHALFVSCTTRLAAMKPTASVGPPTMPHTAAVIKITS